MKHFFLRVMTLCALMIALWASGARADGLVKSVIFALTPNPVNSSCATAYGAATGPTANLKGGQLVGNSLTLSSALRRSSTVSTVMNSLPALVQPLGSLEPLVPLAPHMPYVPLEPPSSPTTQSCIIALTGSQTIAEGDVFMVGSTVPSANFTIIQIYPRLRAEWTAVSGRVSVVSKSASKLTLQLTDVKTSGHTTFNGTITATFDVSNQAPTDIALSGASVVEKQTAGATVGTLSATDPNVGDTFTYALVAGEGDTDNALFALSGKTLQTAVVFDANEENSYSVRVRATDAAGATFEKSFVIAITSNPSFAVSLAPTSPVTTDTLTVLDTLPANTILQKSYQFSVNGENKQSSASASFALADLGQGDKGDVISVVATATDPQSGTVSSATARVTVVNSAPVTFSGVVNAQAGVETPFEFRGADADGDALTFERAGGPVNGTATIRVDPADSKLKLFYTSRARYGGTDLIKFVARDTDGRTSNVATISINVNYVAPPPANRPPVAGDTSIDTYTGKSEVKNLLGSDPDGDPLTFRLIGNAKYGNSEIKRDTDGRWKLFYTSLNKLYGPDAVTYVAVDSKGRTSNIATITLRFINRPPTAQDASFSVASGGAFSTYLFGDDPDGNDISFRQVNGARHGTSEIKRDAQGKWRVYYSSRAGYSGPDNINFATVDPDGRTSAIATVTINVIGVSAANVGGGASAGGS